MAKVQLQNGKSVKMAELEIGDSVQTGENLHTNMFITWQLLECVDLKLLNFMYCLNCTQCTNNYIIHLLLSNNSFLI